MSTRQQGRGRCQVVAQTVSDDRQVPSPTQAPSGSALPPGGHPSLDSLDSLPRLGPAPWWLAGRASGRQCSLSPKAQTHGSTAATLLRAGSAGWLRDGTHSGEVPGPQWQLSGVTHTVLAASPEASAAEGALGEGQGHRARDRGTAWVSGSVESRDERCAHMTEKVRIK